MTNLKHNREHSKGNLALELQNLSLRFDGQDALRDLTLKLESGLHVAVVGPNGAGKSTLFNILAGLLTPSSGRVSIHGHAPAQHMCLAYVTQSSQIDWTFPVSIEEVVMMGRVGLIGLFKQPSRKDWALVRECLDRVQLRSFAHRQISQMSGGQKQRMFIARALAQEADLFLLDEPLAGLDIPSQDQILKTLGDLKQLGITVMFATHDLDLAAKFDRILLLNRKLVAFGNKDEVLTAKNLSLAYGGTMQVVETSEGQIILGDSGGHHGHEPEGRHG